MSEHTLHNNFWSEQLQQSVTSTAKRDSPDDAERRQSQKKHVGSIRLTLEMLSRARTSQNVQQFSTKKYSRQSAQDREIGFFDDDGECSRKHAESMAV